MIDRENVIKTVMTPTEFLEVLKEIDRMADDDLELFHSLADALMCGTLRGLGYGNGVDFFENHEKWYA